VCGETSEGFNGEGVARWRGPGFEEEDGGCGEVMLESGSESAACETAADDDVVCGVRDFCHDGGVLRESWLILAGMKLFW
jgi:hypothetical protein